MLKKSALLFFLFMAFLSEAFSQAQLPDQEALDFHAGRRSVLREKMPPNSVAVFFANPIRNRANDVDYVYHQDPNFYYLTGWPEPHAVLVLYSSPQKDAQGDYHERLYIQERNATAEQWNGYRLGIEGATKMGFDRVALRQKFVNSPLDFSAFDEVLIFEFKNDERNLPNDKYDLYQLKQTFKKAINFPDNFKRNQYRIQQAIRTADPDSFLRLKNYVSWAISRDSTLLDDPIIKDFTALETLEVPADLKMKSAFILKDFIFDVDKLETILGDLREVKTPFELQQLRRAIEISAIGQVEVMKALHPKMTEREVQGIHEYVFKKYGAAYEGYPSIVGGGNNACVLHYIENSDSPAETDLILMDLGAEFKGYTADVTRTLPVNGTFSLPQRQLYEIVYQAQEAGIARAVVGARAREITQVTQEVVQKGLLNLGIIEKPEDYRQYYPHGAVHHIGLDVHDLSNYGPLPANSVITVEPGIYIPKGSPCDPKWWGIGIRIEDDILITDMGPVNLSKGAPRHWKDIEAMMKQPSPLDQFVLPALSN
ncbi:MAG: aminopeptidase P N-terminal domain-containing protein [Flavobacteriaceae bacterium]